MIDSKQDILRQLRHEILQLQGIGKSSGAETAGISLGPVLKNFPNQEFPLGVTHEFISDSSIGSSASAAFVAALSGQLMRKGGACLWIRANRLVHPTGLVAYGIQPEQVIFVDCRTEKQVQWAADEALRCEGLAAVVAECREIDFTLSRRWQIACEKTHNTGFLLRHRPRFLGTTAAMARWKIRPVISVSSQFDLPGMSYPGYEVELLRVKNGRPGNWQLQWVDGKFQSVLSTHNISFPYRRRKAV